MQEPLAWTFTNLAPEMQAVGPGACDDLLPEVQAVRRVAGIAGCDGRGGRAGRALATSDPDAAGERSERNDQSPRLEGGPVD